MESKAEAPLLSVILPVYNGAAYLGEAIDSILNQSYSNFESELNKVWPQAAQTYFPFSNVFQYSPVKARSVPFSRNTWYSPGVSSAFHWASVFFEASVDFAIVFLYLPH